VREDDDDVDVMGTKIVQIHGIPQILGYMVPRYQSVDGGKSGGEM